MRCPITAPDALGPTDGQDGQGQGLLQLAATRCNSLHRSTRAAVALAVLVLLVDLTPFWLERLGRLQRPRISVWAHRRMFDQSYASAWVVRFLLGSTAMKLLTMAAYSMRGASTDTSREYLRRCNAWA